MKYTLKVFILLFSFLTLCSCHLDKYTDEALVKTRIDEIFDVLQKQDVEGLSNMFSQAAKFDSNSFEDDITSLFERLKETKLSYDNDEVYCVDEDAENGLRSKKITVWYHVTGEYDNYIFFFVDWTKNDFDAQKEGLYTLRIIREEDEENQFLKHDQMELPGVYYHPEGKALLSKVVGDVEDAIPYRRDVRDA